tara:strand:- start:230 stop:892 length:663 start_codon:yes stop_codon:yes gene_type:complete
MDEIHAKHNTEYTSQLVKYQHLFHDLQKAWGPGWDGTCGGYLFDGKTYTYDSKSYEKQELLFQKAKKATHALEVGSYVGHSLLIMLLANPKLKITSIDIDNKYTGPAVDLLNKEFGNRIRFIHAHSELGLQQLLDEGAKFDLFHLDGDHTEDLIIREYGFCSKMNADHPRLKIIFDDEIAMRGFARYLTEYRKNVIMELPNCDWSNIYLEFDEGEIHRKV